MNTKNNPRGFTLIELLVAPYMALGRKYQEENIKLRNQYTCRAIDGVKISDILADTPLTITQGEDGKWHYRYILSENMPTGGSSYDTDLEALCSAIKHAADLYQRLENPYEDEF